MNKIKVIVSVRNVVEVNSNNFRAKFDDEDEDNLAVELHSNTMSNDLYINHSELNEAIEVLTAYRNKAL